ncbi:MAG: hypothetical protein IIZ23_07260 [Ruminococcus sp.]|nr:hypothetical protein [Ruminococcus sp.]
MKKVAKKETPVGNPVEEAAEVTEAKAEEMTEPKPKKAAQNWQRVKSHVRRFVRKHFLAIQITEAAIVFAAFCTMLARRGK